MHILAQGRTQLPAMARKRAKFEATLEEVLAEEREELPGMCFVCIKVNGSHIERYIIKTIARPPNIELSRYHISLSTSLHNSGRRAGFDYNGPGVWGSCNTNQVSCICGIFVTDAHLALIHFGIAYINVGCT